METSGPLTCPVFRQRNHKIKCQIYLKIFLEVALIVT